MFLKFLINTFALYHPIAQSMDQKKLQNLTQSPLYCCPANATMTILVLQKEP
ncbi:hypothetical protein KsCSTR_37940 [Candidatus Kuenenia stuttgartiensis]|uniref:Uncharacterized protein n=1 Tax=Kuenenia stuttgartiensis TaxID=174633 RepID=Q1Q623_KUEST|nr:hypothetical protein KsCSTR_37940 [Candidatus Kuenenia stuttgartiensis]CAJ73029.1 unknown protein [Candidatus Kuenenia stuttgartiensis]